MIQFEWPWALLLLPLPYIVRRLVPAAATDRDAALRVPVIEDFDAALTDEQDHVNSRAILIVAGLAWICLVVASSRPQWLGESIEIPVSGRDLMMAVDLSGSMEVEDFEINGRSVARLTATKYVLTEFIKRRKGDRLGLILFGRQAYLQTPLTFDLKTVNTLLQEAVIGLAGKETAIGDAIGLGIKRLKDQSKESRVLILITDGANTAGEVTPLKAAELAAEYGLKIYTIGIGAEEMVTHTIFGARRINPSADLDESTLTAIADKTGGRYFRARDTQQMEEIYELLDELEPVEKDTRSFRPVSDLYFWPLSLALLLSSLIAVYRLRGAWR